MDLYPAHYTLTPEVSRFYNPAFVNINSKASVDLGNQFYTGLYSKIENHYFLAGLDVVGKDSARTKHIISVKAFNEKEGDFITRPKAYLSYAGHVRLSEDYFLGAGASLGMVGYIYKATNVSGGGSATVPDAELGMSFYGRGLRLGISANQLFNKVMLPKELTFRWRRYFTAYLEKGWEFGENHSFTLFAQQLFISQQKDVRDVGGYLVLNRHIELGIMEYIGEKVTFVAGLRELSWGDNAVHLLFAYSVPHTSASQANNQSFEIVLRYQRF